MPISRTRKRTIRLAAILPPLFFLTVLGYWRFLDSRACLSLVELALGRAFCATVTIGGHRIAHPSEIELSDLSIEFLADGRPSGVRFTTGRASAYAARLLGLGPFERVILEDPEARFREAGASVTKLSILRKKAGRPAVEHVEFRDMAVAFESSGKVYRVGGIDLVLHFTGGGLRISADLSELRIEGVQSRRLEEESPQIGFDVEVSKSRVVLRRLSVGGRSGWKVEGDVEADLSGEVAAIRGELQLRDLKISTIYTPKPQTTITTPTGESAAVRRTIRFEGTADDLRISAETDVPEFIYEDSRLGLKSEGTTLKGLRREMRASLTDLLRGLFRDDKKAGVESPDAQGDVPAGPPAD